MVDALTCSAPALRAGTDSAEVETWVDDPLVIPCDSHNSGKPTPLLTLRSIRLVSMLCPEPRRVGKMKAHPRVSFDLCADSKKPLKPSGIKGFFTSGFGSGGRI